MPYAVFIIRALDQSIEEFDKSALFARWIALKQYQGVDYQAKIMHQSLTPEGYAEPPCLAAALTSSLLPAFLSILQGTEQGLNVEFLTNALMFHRKFAVFESDATIASPSRSQGSSSSSSVTRKDMIEEAKRIFAKFLESGDMYCDPGLVDEVRTLINKNGGKGVNPKMFRKIGAFIYHRSEQTWCREARATYEWVNRSYDNRSRSTLAVLDEFSLNNLPEGFDLQIVPSLDDVYGNNVLFVDYAGFIDSQTDKLFEKFLVPFRTYFKSTIQERRSALEKLMNVFAEAAVKFPELEQASAAISKEVATRERVSDSLVFALVAAVARAGAARFYKRWIVEHSMAWKTAAWNPVKIVKVGSLDMIMGMSAVESKIEEAALKGKTGFSRYLAKRQLKKQSIAAVRSTVTASADNNGGETLLDIMNANQMGKKMENQASAFFIPSSLNTFSSIYLRSLFQRAFLEMNLTTSEMALWEAFCGFFNKYSHMSNEELCESQEQMLKEILELCENFKLMIPGYDDLKAKAKKQKMLCPFFFREKEMEIFGKAHAEYEAALRDKGWK